MSINLVNWNCEQKCKKTVKSLRNNGFEAIYYETKQEAFHYIIKEAQNDNLIGFGGSLTIAELGVQQELRRMGKEVLVHNLPELTPDEKMEIRRRQLTCDLFLASTNAVTLTGQLVNIDGHGNRAAAMFFGPKKVIIVAGRNKIVEDTDEALKRIKAYAAPPNARRLNKKTPCAVTGFCNDCNTPDRICRVTVIIDRMPECSDIRVIVVNEDLGL